MKNGQFKWLKQALMRKVLYALVPIIFFSISIFGWGVLTRLIVVSFAAILTEWVFVRKTTGKVTESILVTSFLFTLSLPPTVPYWVAVLGIIFGVVFGKMVFGGFGKNPFNPALVGRAFVYINFSQYLTVGWTRVAQSWGQGFFHYQMPMIDTLTEATPLMLYRQAGETLDWRSLLLGNISGSMGETSALLILFAGLFLILSHTASKEIIFSTLLGFSLTTLAFMGLGSDSVMPLWHGILSGGFLYGAVFMATDPISAPKHKKSKYLYGFLIGLITVVIRSFSLFTGGIMFAILVANTFAPLMDAVFQKKAGVNS